MDASLVPFFEPRGVVVIGASTSPDKLGYGVARNLMECGYPGAIYFVSQKEGELFGHPLYQDLRQISDPIDLAILIVPPGSTPNVIEDCGRRGIKAAIILSSGFREVGAEGAVLEQRCLEVARAYKVRLLGPNCIGTINTRLPLDTTFLQPPMPESGHIGFISQSGAFCAAIIDWARREGFGFSQIVSLGNQADVNETDALSVLAEDEYTRVIVLYMESVSDGRRFVEVARQVARRKPIIALKVGRFESGQKAAASHTGALAASDIAFDASFEKAGILRADSVEQMFDWARALDSYPQGLDSSSRRRGDSTRRIAILTNAGGPGVIAADALEREGLQLAQLSTTTSDILSAHLPPAASLHNPVDMLASASPDTYAFCLQGLLADDHVEGVLVILPPPPMYKAEDVAERLVAVIEQAGRPVVVALLGSTRIEDARYVFQRFNRPTYPFPERAASALAAMAKRAEFLTTQVRSHTDPETNSPPFHVSVENSSPEQLVSAYGIEIAPLRLARSIDEAVGIADGLGYPVVLKIASPDIMHKSDIGGVVTNIKDAQSLRVSYMQVVERAKGAKPEARIEGVHIQRQIPDGQDVIVGAVRDPQFGPLMMFGLGGVEVEGLKDVAFALAPLDQTEAEKMLRKTWAGRKLKGFRHIPPADERSVIDVLIKLSCLILENESIQEIEINPLRVLSNEAIAVDVRVK